MKFVPQRVTKDVCRKVLTIKKNSPHIFFAGGVVGLLGSAYLACRATLKLEEELDNIKRELEITNPIEVPPDGTTVVLEQAQVKNFGRACVKSSLVLGRLYGPSVILGAVSVGALTGSHIQLSRRNAALTATLAAVTKAYDEYRVRVREAVGNEKELDIYRGMREQQIEIDGKKQLVKIGDPNAMSVYARVFDETCREWQRNNEFNRIFLDCQQTYANHLLRARGHLFLNEVYDALGMERSAAGQVVGWVISGDGDGYVDFGIFEPRSNYFVNGYEQSVWLDFNVDGVVYHLIESNGQ